MKKTLLATSILMSSASFAGMYLGASAGVADADQSFLDNSHSFSVTAGYELHDNFALELAYVDLGDMDDNIGAGLSVNIDGLVFSAVGKVPVTESIDLFAKVGLFAWDARADRDAFGTVLKDDGADAAFGVGASLDVTDNLGLYAQFQQFDIDDDEVQNYSLGAQYMF